MPKLIFISSSGRLGNRLQSGSYAVAFAAQFGFSAMLLSLEGFRHHFSGCKNNPFCIFPYKKSSFLTKNKIINLPKALRKILQAFSKYPRFMKFFGITVFRGSSKKPIILTDPEIVFKIQNSKFCIFAGHYIYCDPELLSIHHSQISGFFNPNEITRQTISRKEGELRQKYDLLVGVHIRHGDYKSYKKGEHFFPIEAYHDYMIQVQNIASDKSIHFLVCSDTDLSKINLEGLSWEPGPGDFIEDLFTLSICDYIIGPFSTYNRWAAYYGKSKRYELVKGESISSLDQFKEVSDLTLPISGIA